MTASPLGLIAGNGRFPLLFADEARRRGRRIVALAIEGETDPALGSRVDACHWMKLGRIREAIEIFTAAGVSEAVMAGQVRHVSVFDLRHLDATAIKILATLPDKRTDTILGAVATVFDRGGVRLLPSTTFLTELLAAPGPLGRARPTASQKRDIDFGFRTAKAIAGLDLGQTVCVKDQAVVAIEAIEGTDACIRRAGGFTSGFTAAKVAKPRQDPRFDVPVVGVGTVDALTEARAGVLAVEAGKTLFFDRDEVRRRADETGLVIVGVVAP